MYREFSIMFGESLRKAIDDFRENGTALSNGDESFRQGYLMSLHRVFTLLEQAAEINGIRMEEISLDGLVEGDFLD